MILIGKTHADYTGLKFVITAASRDQSRFILTKLNIRSRDNKLIIEATDGRRYHGYYLSGPEFAVDSNTPFEQGVYDYWVTIDKNIIINRRTDDGLVFPKCEDIIPKAENMPSRSEVPLEIHEFTSRAMHLVNGSYNVDYLADICAYRVRVAVKSWTSRSSKTKAHTPMATIKSENSHSPLLVTTEHIIAVIMPLRFAD